MATAPTSRIAIAGAGIGGLALAGVLTRSLQAKVRISVFERASQSRDQGYGIDLDEYGQMALARAGVYHRYWEVSRPLSDTYAFFGPDSEEPLARHSRPWLLQKLLPSGFGAQPESNRGAVRDMLLTALDRTTTTVHHDTGVGGIRQVGGKAELVDSKGAVLGQYDLVVDAMGIHSPLRMVRVEDKAGKHYSGVVMVHGVVCDPEAVFSSTLLRAIGTNGTSMVFSRGCSFLFLQRFGTSLDDHRLAVFFLHPMPSEDTAFEEIGIAKPCSRSEGIIRDCNRKGQVLEWVKKVMGDHFHPMWLEAIDSLDRVTVRGEQKHGETTLRDGVRLPLVCIGDSLRNVGLGGGGNLAIQDALELADILIKEEGRIDLPSMRKAEYGMLARKDEFNARKAVGMAKLLRGNGSRPFSLANFADDWKYKLMIRLGLAVSTHLYSWDTRPGSTPESPIFPCVKRLL